MNNTDLSHKLRTVIFLTLTLFTCSALAAEVNISARFLADGKTPDKNKFENTTPNSGYCGSYPTHCTNDTFSIAIPNATHWKDLRANKALSISVPYAWRKLDVTHSDGTVEEIEIRVVGMGARYVTDRAVNHNTLWIGGNWLYPPAGCVGTTLGIQNLTSFIYFWRFNTSNPCSKIPTMDARLNAYMLNFMYELKTPNPLTMSTGAYTGSLTYSMGPNGDFRFGDAIFGDKVLTLNFNLSVQHVLRVRFPVGANLLALQPQGGWQQWLNNGDTYRPKKLLANQHFQQWSSTRFKMQLQCQYSVGNDCAIHKGNTLIPVKTMVTLPNGLLNEHNQPVTREPLNNTTPRLFQPNRYVDNQRATLHFEVEKNGVDQMIDGGGGTYRGDVTVVWDSSV